MASPASPPDPPGARRHGAWLFPSLRGYDRRLLRGDVIGDFKFGDVERHPENRPEPGVALVVARNVGGVRDVLRRAEAQRVLAHLHPTVHDAVSAVAKGNK